MEKRFEFALNWLEKTKHAMENINRSDMIVSTKDCWKDIVTSTDIAIEEDFTEHLNLLFTKDALMGEESHDVEDILDFEHQWYLDPIDGTMNYSLQNRNYGVMVAYYHKGVGQFGLILEMNEGNIYYAKKGQGVFKNGEAFKLPKVCTKLSEGMLAINSKIVLVDKFFEIRSFAREALGVRMQGSSALEAIYVLEGWTIAYISSCLSSWDFAASKIILEEAGFKITKWDGSDLVFEGEQSVVMASPLIHEILLEKLKSVDHV